MRPVVLVLAMALSFALPAPVMAASPTLVSLNESPGCQFVDGQRGPYSSANYTGLYMPDWEPVRGAWGDLFGRTIGEVKANLVEVELPMPAPGMAPARVKVHRIVEPALRLAIENLRAEEAKGNYYPIYANQVSSFRPMTIPPNRYMSFHAMGAAVDVNFNRNYYSATNVLTTDMPAWFVKAWTDAGWCWGGHWQSIKDAMHFSWQGPILVPGYQPAAPVPPVTDPSSYTESLTFQSALGAAPEGTASLLADVDRDGVLDVVQVRPSALIGSRFLVAAQSFHGYETCSPAGPTSVAAIAGAYLLMADAVGQGRPDLWEVDAATGSLTLTVHTLGSAFGSVAPTIATGIPWTEGAVLLVGDHQRDTESDLYVVRPGESPTLEIWPGPGFSEKLLEVALPVEVGMGWRFALGDRDVDGIPDLFALGPGTPAPLVILPGAAAFTGAPEPVVTGIPESPGVLQVGDVDGDGRSDLFLLDAGGKLTVYLGGDWHAAAGTSIPMVWPGNYFDFVIAVQQALLALGYLPGVVDGKFGAQTKAAVIAFQKDRGLTPDGIVGPATRGALAQALEEASVGLPDGVGPTSIGLTYWFFESHDRHWTRGAGCPVDAGSSFRNLKVAGMPGTTASLYYSPALGAWLAAGVPAIDPSWTRRLSGTGVDLEAIATGYGNRFAVLRADSRVYVDLLSSRGTLMRTVAFGSAPGAIDLVPVTRWGTWALGVLVDRGTSAGMWIRSATSGWLLANVWLGSFRPTAAVAVDVNRDRTSEIVVAGMQTDGRTILRVVSQWSRLLGSRVFPAGIQATPLGAVSTPSGTALAVLVTDTASGEMQISLLDPTRLTDRSSQPVPAGARVTVLGANLVQAYRDSGTAAVWYEGRNALTGEGAYSVETGLGFDPAAVAAVLGGGLVFGAQRSDDGTIRVERRDAAGVLSATSHFYLRPVSSERRGIG